MMNADEIDAVDQFVDWMLREIVKEGLFAVTPEWINDRALKFEILETQGELEDVES